MIKLFCMSEKFIRHLASFLGTLALLIAWFGGYISGDHGWWWAGIGVLIFYGIIYSLLEV